MYIFYKIIKPFRLCNKWLSHSLYERIINPLLNLHIYRHNDEIETLFYTRLLSELTLFYQCRLQICNTDFIYIVVFICFVMIETRLLAIKFKLNTYYHLKSNHRNVLWINVKIDKINYLWKCEVFSELLSIRKLCNYKLLQNSENFNYVHLRFLRWCNSYFNEFLWIEN